MIAKSRWRRSPVIALGTLVAFLAVIGIINAVAYFYGLYVDRRARAAADRVTETYRTKFELGDSLAIVEQAINASHVPELHRDQNILVVVAEGQKLWYCNHNFFGTAFSFRDGTLAKIATENWPGACL